MKSSKTQFYNAIEGARNELSGFDHYDHEYGGEYNFPAKDPKKYDKAYEYCYITLQTYFQLDDTIKEIELIRSQIQHSQDYALQNEEFTTDFILSFSYKNWIIRINIISEQLFFLVNHLYGLKLSNKELSTQLFEHLKVKEDKDLYFALLNLVDFLQASILLKVNTKKLKSARNQIVHHANFSHDTISDLSTKLFLYQWGLSENKDHEDIYLDEGQASEKIKNEIESFTTVFTEKCLPLYVCFAKEFSNTFNLLIK